jgi:hypothetical protein
MRGTKVGNKFILNTGNELFLYRNMDISLPPIKDMLINSFYFWQPTEDRSEYNRGYRIDGIYRSFSDKRYEISQTTLAKQKQREKDLQDLRRIVDSRINFIKNSNNLKIFNFSNSNLDYKVQKIELVGNDKIRVKIIDAQLYENNKPGTFQGVKLIQGAEFVVDLEELVRFNMK